MAEKFSIGLVGARGYAGSAFLNLVAQHPRLSLAFAASRAQAGEHVPDPLNRFGGLEFEALDAEAAAARKPDIALLALPDGVSSGYVEAFERLAPETALVDFSADYRFDQNWAYGLPELYRDREGLAGARRIANPGCYATAAQLAVHPVLELLAGPPAIFGVSGYSGAGTTPGPRNDPGNLQDNLIPYALTGHKHEREVIHHLGQAVSFTPHVHEAFSGLLTTVHLSFRKPLESDALQSYFDQAFKEEPLIRVQKEVPDLRDGSGIPGAIIGGFSVSADGRYGVVVAAIDNLLKGAAVQAMQNVNLALGGDELAGTGQELARGPHGRH